MICRNSQTAYWKVNICDDRLAGVRIFHRAMLCSLTITVDFYAEFQAFSQCNEVQRTVFSN